MSGIFKKFRKGDIQITPYEAHKEYLVYVNNYTGSYAEVNYEQWIIDSVGNTQLVKPLNVYAYDAEFDSNYFDPDITGRYGQITYASPMAKTTNGYFKRSIHESIQGMYYTNPDDPAYTLDNSGYEKEFRVLHKSAQVLSIPQRMFGDSIEKGSIVITGSGFNIYDDGFGNLIDIDIQTEVLTSNIVNLTSSIALSLNFNEMYNKSGKEITAHSINLLAKDTADISNKTRFFEKSKYANKVEAYKIIPNTGSVNEGTVIKFDGVTPITSGSRRNLDEHSSLIKVRHGKHLDLRDDWTMSIRVKADGVQPSSGSAGNDTYIITKYDNIRKTSYPFAISLINTGADAGKIRFKTSDGGNVLELKSAAVLSTSNFENIEVTYDATIREYKLYHNGSNVATGTGNSAKHHNASDILIGGKTTIKGHREKIGKALYATRAESKPEYDGKFAGELSEIEILNTKLSSTAITNYKRYAKDIRVGNVFYNHGLLAITHQSSSYANVASECTLSFRNTHTIFENEFSCHIKEREFGYTTNPSIIDDDRFGSLKSFTTTSAWSPYVTTIGLYDNNARLVAIGKLSQPLKKSEDYDTTFVVRFDT